MPFRPEANPPQFADLKGSLAQSKNNLDHATYQTIQLLIERLQTWQKQVEQKLAEADPDNQNGNVATKFATYITEQDESLSLPNSRELIAGTGITLDASVANEITINGSGGGYAPVSTGAEPLEVMSDGAGAVLMIGFTP
jgi:hypothetical protein